jgi:hypothetical protein
MITSALVGIAVLLVIAALAAGLRAGALAGGEPGWAAAAGGAALALVAGLLDGGHALRWRYGVASDGARVELPGVGLLLGLALLGALAGTLMTLAALVSGAAPREKPRLLGRRLLMLAAGLGALAGGLLCAELVKLDAIPAAGLRAAALLLGATGFLAAGLLATLSDLTSGDAASVAKRAARLGSAAAFFAAAAVVAAGSEAWIASGGQLAPRALSVLAAALVTLAAREATLLPNGRRVLALAALVLALAP